MKLPHHPALPLLSLALLAYLSGDLACAVMGRQFSNRTPHLQAGTPTAPSVPTNPGEWMAILNGHPQVSPSPNGPDGLDPLPTPSVTDALPTLVGTLEGQGQALAMLQAQGSQDPMVVAVGENFQEFQVLEVGAFRARLRDASNQDHTVFMRVENETSAPPPPQPPLVSLPVPPSVFRGRQASDRPNLSLFALSIN